MQLFVIDSFTNERFKGNPAGVCWTTQALDDALMLSIAKELKHSETAFMQQKNEAHQFSIRYFSPKMEIPLCGHATLAASKVLFEKTDLEFLDFQTIQGLHLAIAKKDHQIEMTFPVYDTKAASVPPALLKALGIPAVVNSVYNKETNILLLEIENASFLANLTPDFEVLYRSHDSINGVLVTAPAHDDGYDFHSRYFWPWSGTNEDPVTGGTHTFLTGYWAKRLGKSKLKSFQSSPRTGFMEVELTNTNQLKIRGEAICVLEGKLNL